MRWIDDIDDFLLNVMLEEQNNGNKPNQTCNSHAYSNMCKKCYAIFGYTVEKSNIKNGIKTLKGTFHHVMTFSWTWVDLHGIQLLDFLSLKLKCENL